MSSLKPGIKTSEFWIVIVTQLLSFLVLLGILNSEDQTLLMNSAAEIITGISSVVANGIIVCKYIQSRTDIKTEALKYFIPIKK